MGLDKYTIPVKGIKVLVVDDDMTSLTLVSKMLCTLGYEVATATLASEALSVIEKDENIGLVMMELHISNIKKYGLIKIIKERYGIPSCIMSADDDPSSMSRALLKGAKLYLTKPVAKSDLRHLWQFSMCKRVGRDQERPALTNEEEEEELTDQDKDKDNVGVGKNESQVQKKQRLKWTNDLRAKFLEAIGILGANAGPKKIQEHMNVPDITKKQVSSRLQKYRLSLKKQANEVKQHRSEQQSGLSLGSDHLSHMDVTSCTPTSSLDATPSSFPSVQSIDFNQNQLLCLPRAMQGVEPATSGNVGPSYADYNMANAEHCPTNWGLPQIPCNTVFNQVENATGGNVETSGSLLGRDTTINTPFPAGWHPLHGSGDVMMPSVDYRAANTEPGPANWGLPNDSDVARFSQVGNSVDGNIFGENASLYCQDATRNMFGSCEWNPLHGSGDAIMPSMDYTPRNIEPCPSNWGHLLGSDSTSVSCVNSIAGNNEMDCSTLLANDNMCQQVPSQLPVIPPPLPSDGLEHFNFGAGAGNLEDHLKIPKETPQLFEENMDVSREDQQFFAEDFDTCIKNFLASL